MYPFPPKLSVLAAACHLQCPNSLLNWENFELSIAQHPWDEEKDHCLNEDIALPASLVSYELLHKSHPAALVFFVTHPFGDRHASTSVHTDGPDHCVTRWNSGRVHRCSHVAGCASHVKAHMKRHADSRYSASSYVVLQQQQRLLSWPAKRRLGRVGPPSNGNHLRRSRSYQWRSIHRFRLATQWRILHA